MNIVLSKERSPARSNLLFEVKIFRLTDIPPLAQEMDSCRRAPSLEVIGAFPSSASP